MANNYAVVIIKPDAIRDGLTIPILKDLEREAVVIPVFCKLWKITAKTVRLIYPEWIKRFEFPSMTYNLTQGSSLFVIVQGETNIYESLKQVKGK